MQDTNNSDQPTIYNQQQNGYDQNYGTDTTQPPKKVHVDFVLLYGFSQII